MRSSPSIVLALSARLLSWWLGSLPTDLGGCPLLLISMVLGDRYQKNQDFSLRTCLVFLVGLLGASVHSEGFRLKAKRLRGRSLLCLERWATFSSCSCRADRIWWISRSASARACGRGSSSEQVRRSMSVLIWWAVGGRGLGSVSNEKSSCKRGCSDSVENFRSKSKLFSSLQ